MPFQNIDIIIDIVRNMHIDIGIDIDIGKIGPIFFRFSRKFLQGLLSLYRPNFIRLPLQFC